MLQWNPQNDYPQIDATTYVDKTAVFIGKVHVGKNCFIGPGAVIRADEKNSEIVIHDNCNVQDRVIIHCLEGSKVVVHKNTSLTHGCIIHGPCEIGQNCFIGFGSIIFDALLGQGVVVKHQCCVEGVIISSNKLVESGRTIKCQKEENSLKLVDRQSVQFVKNIVNVNLNLMKDYKR